MLRSFGLLVLARRAEVAGCAPGRVIRTGRARAGYGGPDARYGVRQTLDPSRATLGRAGSVEPDEAVP